jgi:hypothetical protein
MNIMNQIYKNFQVPAFGFNASAFGGVIRDPYTFGVHYKHRDKGKPDRKPDRILISVGKSEYAPKMKDVSHIYQTLTKAGYEVDFVTADNKPISFSMSDLSDPVNRWFAGDADAQYKINHPVNAKGINPEEYAAFFLANGSESVVESNHLRRLIKAVLANHGVVAGTGAAEDVPEVVKEAAGIQNGYSLPGSGSAVSVTEYGSAAVAQVSTATAWVINKHELLIAGEEEAEHIGEFIKNQLENS